MHLTDYEDKEFNNYEYIDKWILAKYEEMEKQFIKYLDNYEIGLGLNALEKFFWDFCDNYIEIVKHRLYRPEEFGDTPRYSGQKTVYTLLYKLLQNFSIYFPFITEEIFSELYHTDKSIHLTEIKPLDVNYKEELRYGNMICDIISSVRGEKSINNLSLKTEVKLLDIFCEEKLQEAIDSSIKDFKATLFINNLNINSLKEGYNINKIELDLSNSNNE